MKQLVTLDCFYRGVASSPAYAFSRSSSFCTSISLFLWNSDFMTFSATNSLSLRSSFVKSLRLLLRSYSSSMSFARSPKPYTVDEASFLKKPLVAV